MKSAYELAMERLNQSAPQKALSDEQKAEIAEMNRKYQAKLAEREIFLKGEIEKAMSKGEFDAVQDLEKQLVGERKALEGELEEKKEAVRNRA